jgi:hypothetical protein
MIEVFVLIALGKNMVRIAHTKQRSGTPFVLLLLACWFGGEFGGGFAAAVVEVIATGRPEPTMGIVYLFALLGAVAGAFLAGQIAKAIPPKRQVWHDEEEDDEAGEAAPRRHHPQTGEFYDPESRAHRPPPGTEFRATDE